MSLTVRFDSVSKTIGSESDSTEAIFVPAFTRIACATVHQFQGSEKDVIIYDSVDCYREKHPGYLLTSMTNNYANRLFNVALTRAKGKFVGIANINYMDNKNLSDKLMLKQMIQYQKRSCFLDLTISFASTFGEL